MRIVHNIPAMITQGQLVKTNRALQKNLEKLATGLRINRASDDAAGLGVSENLRTQVRGTAQAQRNAMDGIAALNIAEGAGGTIAEILQRMRELAIQSANDTFTSLERTYTNQEFAALNDEINRIASVTNYNGMKLLEGSGVTRFGNTDSVLWIDANETVGIDSITVTIDTLNNGTGGLNTASLDLMAQTSAVQSIGQLDYAIDRVNQTRADIGAYINRLEHTINHLANANTNQAAAESVIRDVDFAHETASYTKNQILMQSGTAMLAQANIVPQSVLQLLN